MAVYYDTSLRKISYNMYKALTEKVTAVNDDLDCDNADNLANAKSGLLQTHRDSWGILFCKAT